MQRLAMELETSAVINWWYSSDMPCNLWVSPSPCHGIDSSTLRMDIYTAHTHTSHIRNVQFRDSQIISGSNCIGRYGK